MKPGTRSVSPAGGAVLVGAIALGVYIRTLAPGLVAITDTPGFQFVGRVLGTLHNPGYPTYVLITYLWSYLPVGTLAYRINLFSAVTGALTVAGFFVLARGLDVRPWIAGALALGMAFGSIFWSQAVIAEVYMLNAALIVWMLAAAVAWGRTRRRWMFFAGVALLALGLGNHTTIVLFAPGLLLFALLSDRRFALMPSTIGLTLALLGVGLAPYGFILVRSLDPGAYLESRASNLAELVDVIRGAQFENALFRFTPGQILHERLPLIVHRFLAAELSYPVFFLACAGAPWLLLRRRREGVLIVCGGLAAFAFVLNYDAGDIHVFTIPVLVVLWTCAAFASEGVLSSATARHGVLAGVIPALAIAFPGWQFARNYQTRDMSRETATAREVDALFRALPDRTFLVRQDFVLDRVLMYKLLGERAAGTREIQAHFVSAADAASMHASGLRVFAFPQTARRFRFDGVDVSFGPLPTYPWSLAERLAEAEHGALIALAVPGVQAAGFARSVGPALERLAPGVLHSGRDQEALAIVARKGVPAEARVRTSSRSEVASDMMGIRAVADSTSATVRLGTRDLARTENGALLVIRTAGGALQTVAVLTAEEAYRLNAAPGPYSAFEVGKAAPSRHLSADWSEIDASGGLALFRMPAGGEVTIASPLADGCNARVVDQSASDTGVRVETVRREDADPHVMNLLVTAARQPLTGYQLVTLTAPAADSSSAVVATGCTTRLAARATMAGTTTHRVNSRGLMDVPGRAGDTVLMARTEQAWLLGAGWSAVETDDTGPFRWLEGPSAGLVLPVRRHGATRVRLQGYAREAAAGDTLSIRIDGVALGPRPLSAGWNWYEWDVPAGLLSAGVHRLSISGPSRPTGVDGRLRDVAVSLIEVLGRREW